MRLKPRFLLPLICLSVWSLLIYAAPISVGWRDSGEFIITSFFLDIPHPAGFPIYSVFSNGVSLLLSGPVAWRTHIFSLLIVLVIFYHSYQLANEVISKFFLTSKNIASWILPTSIATALLALTCSNATWRSIQTAEVYGLHTLFLIIIARLLLGFHRLADARLLYLAAFVGGLSLTNHVVALLYGMWIGAVLVVFRKLTIRTLCTSVVCCLAGLSVYFYIPVRASAHPPLNTGSPTTLHRFYQHITDARDFDLRNTESGTKSSFQSGLFEKLQHDAARLIQDTNVLFTLGAISGGVLLTFYLPFEGVLLWGIPVTTHLFFLGWDIDPWLPSLVISSLFLSCALSEFFRILSQQASRQLTAGLAVIIIIAITYQAVHKYRYATRGSTQNGAIALAESTFHATAPFGLLISDASWFITKYAQAIEGIAPQITSLYLPSILFPSYFNPASIRSQSTMWEAQETENPREPVYSNLFKLIDIASAVAPIQIEPNISTVEKLVGILIFDQSGTIQLRRNEDGAISSEFLTHFVARINSFVEAGAGSNNEIWADIDEHVKILLSQLYYMLMSVQADSAKSSFCSEGQLTFIREKNLPKSAQIVAGICAQ